MRSEVNRSRVLSKCPEGRYLADSRECARDFQPLFFHDLNPSGPSAKLKTNSKFESRKKIITNLLTHSL